MEKIIYPYVRFSSEQQSGGSSYKRQMGDILKYAKENGYTVNNSLELKDLGLSAYFGEFRSVISGLSDHPFRFKPITDSAVIRSLLA